MHRKGLEIMATAAAKEKTPAYRITTAEKLLNRIVGLHRYILPCIYNLELPLPDYPASDYGYDDESMALDEISKGREMISESPFYCPAADYAYLQTTPYADARTMDLLKDIRDYYIVLEHEQQATKSLDKELAIIRRLALRARILDYESAHSANSRIRKRVEKDYVYESIRLTSLSLIHLSDTCLPIRAAFTLSATVVSGANLSVKEKRLKPLRLDTPSSKPPVQRASLITSPQPSQIIPQLAYNLRKGPNAVIGWGLAMEGVLYWITTIGTAIARGRREYRLFSSLNAKTIFDMATSTDGRTWDEGFIPIRTFIKFQQMCLNQEITRLVEVCDD
jgi:hypothetical protein